MESFVADVGAAVMDSDDPETVRQGLPAFLLMMEGRLRGDSADTDLLTGAAALYSAYAGAFVADADRQARLAARAFSYASRALSIARPDLGDLRSSKRGEFEAAVETIGPDDVDLVFLLAQAWMTRIRALGDDLESMADLPRVQALLERLLELDEDYREGAVHLFLGILRSMREVAMGSDPAPARRHFERALELSERRSLMVQVAYARTFAAVTGDRELFESLLREVLDADPHEPGRTLMNAVAKEEARALLAAR